MKQLEIEVPKDLDFKEAINFAKVLSSLPLEGKFVFDFKHSNKIDPFSLLYLSSEIHRCRSKRTKADFRARNFSHLTYPAHMGFFKAFGLEHGKTPGEAKGSDRYIPITILDAERIRQDAKDSMINPGELLEGMAKKMSAVLIQSEEGDLFDIVVYSMREILRNVVEHSRCQQFGVCAQYWPSLKKVSLAVLDRGIGIKEALSNNPNLDLKSDEEALSNAIQPGVSGKVFKGQRKKPKGEWANSGYGLYMTSNICRKGGSFFLASGSKGLYMFENKARYLDTPLQGTAVNMSLSTARIANLKDTLKDLREAAKTNSEASLSSLGLSSTF